MNPGLAQQATAAKNAYRASNPKAKHISVRKVHGQQIHVHGGEFCDEQGYSRYGIGPCLAYLDNADVIFELEYATSADPERRFYFYWATVAILNGKLSLWAD